MTDRDYQDLLSLATKGDKSSLSALFSLGDQALADGKFEEAANIFRESACCYRISASRNDAKAEDLAFSERQLLSTREIYLQWFNSHASELMLTFPIKAEGITRDFILTCLRDDLWHDQTMPNLLDYIEISLEKHGMEFFSPGGSPLRRIVEQLCLYFGVFDNEENYPDLRAYRREYLDFPDVRIGMDLLADEVLKRFRQLET